MRIGLNKDVNLSYWELKSYFKIFDLIIVGSGIVGLSSAISYKLKNKKAKILILERGFLPNGASTKNAGFACFGSIGELLDDFSKMPEKSVLETIAMRWNGLQMLRKRLGDKNIGFKALGGFELFESKIEFESCYEEKTNINAKIKLATGLSSTFNNFNSNNYAFKNIKGIIKNQHEGQLDTGLMMTSLINFARHLEIEILNNIDILKIIDTNSGVELISDKGTFKANKVIVATNGFASQLLRLDNVKPARAQVLITKPIADLKIKGAFHFNQGFYYFRNIDNRILFGGGRNLDLEKETTTVMGLNTKIQNRLNKLLSEFILPGINFEIEHRWSGIMGVGSEKKPIIKPVSPNVLAAVRMGGMGIAIGSWVGEIAANEIN